MVPTPNYLFFSLLDYSLFIGVLLISALIGVYFGFFAKKQDNRKEYMHGGRSMKILPIAASLVATDISGITLLAVPADVYLVGSSYWWCIVSGILSSIILAYVYLPVFFKLRLNSSFEYLRMRFDSRVCVAASATFLLTVVAYMPIIIYIPALAFSQVSGVNLNIVIPIVCMICIFYTTIGGIKAVVWTDTIQMIIMAGSMITVVTLGMIVGGGFMNVWNTSVEGGRIDMNLDFDPTSRTSGVAVIIGLLATYCGYGNNPVYIQRFLTLPSYEHAKKTNLAFCIGSSIFKTFSVFVGLIMYARYYDCDPISAKLVQKPDQMVPFYVMDISSSLPGLPGLFIAGIFCAALSTMSSGLNTLAGTIYEDFMATKMSKDISEKRISDIMKIISVLLGLVCMIFVFLVQYLGALFQLTLKVTALAGGPILAMFSLGMLVPFVNTKGILYGVVGAITFVGWLLFGAIYYELTGKLPLRYKSFSIEHCEHNITQLFYNTTKIPDEDLPIFPYRITFYYYGLIGAIITSLIAIPISIFSGGDEQTVDKDLLSPIIYPFLSDKYKSMSTTTAKQEEEELKNLNVVNVDPISKIMKSWSVRRKEIETKANGKVGGTMTWQVKNEEADNRQFENVNNEDVNKEDVKNITLKNEEVNNKGVKNDGVKTGDFNTEDVNNEDVNIRNQEVNNHGDTNEDCNRTTESRIGNNEKESSNVGGSDNIIDKDGAGKETIPGIINIKTVRSEKSSGGVNNAIISSGEVNSKNISSGEVNPGKISSEDVNLRKISSGVVNGGEFSHEGANIGDANSIEGTEIVTNETVGLKNISELSKTRDSGQCEEQSQKDGTKHIGNEDIESLKVVQCSGDGNITGNMHQDCNKDKTKDLTENKTTPPGCNVINNAKMFDIPIDIEKVVNKNPKDVRIDITDESKRFTPESGIKSMENQRNIGNDVNPRV